MEKPARGRGPRQKESLRIQGKRVGGRVQGEEDEEEAGIYGEREIKGGFSLVSSYLPCHRNTPLCKKEKETHTHTHTVDMADGHRGALWWLMEVFPCRVDPRIPNHTHTHAKVHVQASSKVNPPAGLAGRGRLALTLTVTSCCTKQHCVNTRW